MWHYQRYPASEERESKRKGSLYPISVIFLIMEKQCFTYWCKIWVPYWTTVDRKILTWILAPTRNPQMAIGFTPCFSTLAFHKIQLKMYVTHINVPNVFKRIAVYLYTVHQETQMFYMAICSTSDVFPIKSS